MTQQMSVAPVRAGSLELAVLGVVEARIDSKAAHLGGPKQRTVLAVLIAAHGRRVSTGQLVEALYGEQVGPRARHTVQTYVSNLRKKLGDVIERQPDGYLLDIDRAHVDATRFEALAREARETLAGSPETSARLSREALALWRGHPYADVDGGTALLPEITRLSDLRLGALETRIEADLALGRHEELVPELEALAAEHPYRESLRALHMHALYRSGRQAEALRAYETTRTVLVEELGIDPTPALQALQLQILEHDERLDHQPQPTVRHRALLAAEVDVDLLTTAIAPERRVAVSTESDQVVTNALARRSGTAFDQRLNATFAHFDSLDDALTAARDIVHSAPRLSADDHRRTLCIAVDVGDVETDRHGGLGGPVVTRVAGLLAMAHAGQILLSTAAQSAAARDGGWTIKGLGDHHVPGLEGQEGIHQLVIPGEPALFPPPRSAVSASVPVAMRSMPGYELREEIDRRHGWSLWRGYQPSVGREVAIRILGSVLSGRPEFVRRFELEALTVARLEHPHIVPLFDYWRDLSGAYLVTRWVQGKRLSSRLAEGPLSVSEATRLIEQVGSALDAAHGAGVAHGHVTPRSIILDEQGAFFLTDFGIARETTLSGEGTHRDLLALAETVSTSLEGNDRDTSRLADTLGAAASLSTIAELRAAWAAAVGQVVMREEGFTETRNPYRGLSAFTYGDARDFFGRQRVVAELVERVAAQRLTAVVGPSGVGKSSLVQAGLVPALVDGALPGSASWFIASMTPGAHPFESLAATLSRVATHSVPGLETEIRDGPRAVLQVVRRLFPADAEVLIIIDQFEELFTLTDEATRRAFLRSLTTALSDPAGGLRMAVTLRADFFDQSLQAPEFGALMRAATMPLSTPTNDKLVDIVVRPAASVGVRVDPQVVERALHDVGEEPGRLPLLEYTLTELFDQRETDLIGLEQYQQLGGVVGALGHRAESLYQGLGPAAANAAQQLFLRLVTLSETQRPTRRRVRMTELRRLGVERSALEDALEVFGRHRLITLDRDPMTHSPTVEVAHEALFAEWNRLANWIEARRDDLVIRRRLHEATTEWESAARNETMLLTGPRLGQFEEWVEGTDLVVSASERDLLQASIAKRQEDASNRRRRRRLVTAGFAMAALVGLILAGIAGFQRDRAQRAADVATAQRLSAQSIVQLDVDPERSVLLALEALSLAQASGADLLEPTTALRQAIAVHRITDRFEGGTFVAVSPDGELVAMGDADGGTTVRTLATGEVVATLLRDDGEAIGAEFAPSGDRIAVFYRAEDMPVWIWDLAGDQPLKLEAFRSTVPASAPQFVAFDDAGEFVVAPVEDSVHVWSAVTGELTHRFSGTWGAAIIPGTQRVLAAVPGGPGFAIFDAVSAEPIDSFPTAFDPETFAVSPDGTLVVATAQAAESLAAYDLATGTEVWVVPIDRSVGVEWLADGDRLAVGSDGGRIVIVDGLTGNVTTDLRGGHYGGAVWALAAVPGRAQLVTSGSTDGTTIVWDVERGPRPEVARLDTGAARAADVGFAPYPDQVFVSEIANASPPRVLDTDTLETVFEVEYATKIHDGVDTHVVGDGSLLATVTIGEPSTLRDTRTGNVLYTAPLGQFVRAVSLDGRRVLIAPPVSPEYPSGGVQIVEVASGDVLVALDAPQAFVPSFSSDGAWVHDVDRISWDGRLLDAASGELVLVLPDTRSIRPMPGGEMISVVDGSGVMWHADVNELISGAALEDAARWSEFATQGLILASGHVANSDGTLVSTAGRGDQAVKIWDTSNGEQVAELDPGLRNGEPQVFFHPDAPHVTALSRSGVLLTYTLDNDELIAIAESRLSRGLTDTECSTFLGLPRCLDDAPGSA